MKISTEVLQSAANSRLGRLDIQGNDNEKHCVLRNSFSGWMVHIFRYRFSKNYRAQELEKRRQILVAALSGGEDYKLSQQQQEVLLSRRGFNRYIQAESKKLVKPAPDTEVTAPRIPTPAGNTVEEATPRTPTPPPVNTDEKVTPAHPENLSVETAPVQVHDTPADTPVTQEQSIPPSAAHDPDKSQPPARAKKGLTAAERLQQPTAASGARGQKEPSRAQKRSAEVRSKGNKTPTSPGNIRQKKTSDTGKAASTPRQQRATALPKDAGRSGKNQPATGKNKPGIKTAETVPAKPGNTTATPQTAAQTGHRRPQAVTNKFIEGNPTAPSDNAAWIRARNRHVSSELDAGHFADIFEIKKGRESVAYQPVISSTGYDPRLIAPIATLEKRIGERLEQCVGTSGTNTNSKHFLTYLTLKNKNAPGGTLFEAEHMKKSSPDEAWKNELQKGGLSGVPLEADGCVRRVPDEKLMRFVTNVIKELPVDKDGALTHEDKKSHPLNQIHNKGGKPEYRKQFSRAGEELTEADFKWVVANIAGFVGFCRSE